MNIAMAPQNRYILRNDLRKNYIQILPQKTLPSVEVKGQHTIGRLRTTCMVFWASALGSRGLISCNNITTKNSLKFLAGGGGV